MQPSHKEPSGDLRVEQDVGLTESEEDSLYMVLASMLHLSPQTQLDSQQNEIISYAIDHQLPVDYDERGYYIYKYVNKSDAETVDWGDRVRVHYVGRYLDDDIFDSSYEREQPMDIVVGAMIPGFNFGLMRMRVGERAIFLLPSYLAYGDKEFANIPPSTPLVFEVEVLKMLKKRAKN